MSVTITSLGLILFFYKGQRKPKNFGSCQTRKQARFLGLPDMEAKRNKASYEECLVP